MERDFRAPKDFASFLYVGQVLQATVIKYAAEAHRRAMGRNWGTLYWQLDDCWPVASWSSIDYYGRWKALQYAARRFFAPVLVSPVDHKGSLEIWGVSDRRTDTPARLTIRVLDFSGHELGRRDQDLTLAANSSQLLVSFRKKELLGSTDPRRVVLVAELSEGGRPAGPLLARNLFWFEKTKDLELPKPQVTLDVTPSRPGIDGAFTIVVRANALARAVRLDAGTIDGSFDDNYFDLLPNEATTVTFRPHAATTLAALKTALHATTIVDSY
jgi:beta-mannosidase